MRLTYPSTQYNTGHQTSLSNSTALWLATSSVIIIAYLCIRQIKLVRAMSREDEPNDAEQALREGEEAMDEKRGSPQWPTALSSSSSSSAPPAASAALTSKQQRGEIVSSQPQTAAAAAAATAAAAAAGSSSFSSTSSSSAAESSSSAQVSEPDIPRRRSYTKTIGGVIDVQGEIITAEGWRRHTRVYGGGVCLACLESERRLKA